MASPILDALPMLLKRDDNSTNSNPYENCTDISPVCPLDQTIYGYYPNVGANAFFAAIFGICLIANSYLGIRYRTWTYLIALWFGCLGEIVGFIGRIILLSNPWSATGFEMQICCLIISPAFFAAGVYLT